jgi:hypothetical protein
MVTEVCQSIQGSLTKLLHGEEIVPSIPSLKRGHCEDKSLRLKGIILWVGGGVSRRERKNFL